MSSSDVSSVVNFFSTANEGFSTTLGSTISAGATTVPLNNTAGLINGNIFVGIIEPGATAEQVFTGTVNIGSAQISNVVWTRGTNVGHASGVTIVDYVTGTQHNMATTGILKSHNQDGTPKSGITYPASTFTTPTLNTPTVNSPNYTGTATGSLTSAVLSNPYKFSVYRNAGWTAGALATVVFDTKNYDTGSNFSVSTGLFTAPVAGFYRFTTGIGVTRADQDVFCNVILWKNGTTNIGEKQNAIAHTIQPSQTTDVTREVQLSANDTVGVQIVVSVAGTTGQTGNANTWFDGSLISAT